MENNTNDDIQSIVKAEKETFIEDNCPMTNALGIIGGKWKLLLLNKMREECPARFGELSRKMKYITHTTLTLQLRELERDGIISRTVYGEVPPRVEYQFTALGKTLIPLMDALVNWGKAYCKVSKQ